MIPKVIKGFENYLITDTGRVYSLKSGRYLKAHLDKDGYERVLLYKNGKRSNKPIHRLVARAFLPNSKNKPTVHITNGEKEFVAKGRHFKVERGDE